MLSLNHDSCIFLTQCLIGLDECDLWCFHLQMLYDGAEFLNDAEDNECGSDSEDSNAEMHYTHDYPDEEDSQHDNGDTSEYDSDGDSL